MDKFLKLLAIILFCNVTFAQAANNTTVNPITIGALYNLTGSQSSLDKPSLQGAELAVAEINANGGVLGRPLKLKTLDCQSKQDVVAQNAEKLTSSKDVSDLIIGLNDTDLAITAIPIITFKQKIFITSGATSPKLSALAPKSVLYTCFVDSDQAHAAAEFAYGKLNAKNSIVITQSDMEYSQLLSKYFQRSFSRLGGNVVATGSFGKDSPDINTSINLWKNHKIQPDFFFLATGPDTALQIIKQIRQAGFQQPIIGGDSFDGIALASNNKINDVYFTTHGFITGNNPESDVKNFVAAFNKKYHKNPNSSFAGLGYDTIMLSALAMKNAQSTEGTKIRAAFMNIKNYDGITGTFSYFDPNPVPAKTVTIVKFQNGNKIFIEERLPKNRT